MRFLRITFRNINQISVQYPFHSKGPYTGIPWSHGSLQPLLRVNKKLVICSRPHGFLSIQYRGAKTHERWNICCCLMCCFQTPNTHLIGCFIGWCVMGFHLFPPTTYSSSLCFSQYFPSNLLSHQSSPFWFFFSPPFKSNKNMS